MANTLIPIQTVTVGAGGASDITFSNIPQTYTDLLLKVSFRTTSGGANYTGEMTINGTTTGYTGKDIVGTGASVTSNNRNYAFVYIGEVNGGASTSGTFTNKEIYIPNYTSSNYKSISIDSAFENNATTAYAQLEAILWSNNAAITSLKVFEETNSLAQYSTATLYGVSNGVKATGGTLTVAGGYAYHTFTSTGSFLPNQQIKGAEVLMVAGGGGSGGDYGGGGGGAGGYVYAYAQTLTAGNSYTALVGAGGTAYPGNQTIPRYGGAGSNSQFSSLTAALGGGGGASDYSGNRPGQPGGSGGGNSRGAASPGGLGTVGQGNNGGTGLDTSSGYPGGGGGGAGGVGGDAPNSSYGGAGGIGTTICNVWHSVTGTGALSGGVYYIAGGGAGGSRSGTTALGGLGGGGNSNTVGTANTGGGGGGANGSGNDVGKAGGSGLIIVRYPLS